jgi:hypothetical protein
VQQALLVRLAQLEKQVHKERLEQLEWLGQLEKQVHKERLERKELLENKVCKGSLVRKEYLVDPLELLETKDRPGPKERRALQDKRERKE